MKLLSLWPETTCYQAGRPAGLSLTKHLPTRRAIWGSSQGGPSQLQPALPRSPCHIPGARKGKGSSGAQSRNAWCTTMALASQPRPLHRSPLPRPSGGVNQASPSACLCASEPVESSRLASSVSELRVCSKGGKHVWVTGVACRGNGYEWGHQGTSVHSGNKIQIH